MTSPDSKVDSGEVVVHGDFEGNAERCYLRNRVQLLRLLNGEQLTDDERAAAARASYTQQRRTNRMIQRDTGDETDAGS